MFFLIFSKRLLQFIHDSSYLMFCGSVLQQVCTVELFFVRLTLALEENEERNAAGGREEEEEGSN